MAVFGDYIFMIRILLSGYPAYQNKAKTERVLQFQVFVYFKLAISDPAEMESGDGEVTDATPTSMAGKRKTKKVKMS